MERKTVIVDGKEVNAAKFLAALHNNTQPLGLGFLSSRPNMTAEEAAKDLAQIDSFNFDYYHGRPLKTGCRHDAPGVIDTDFSRRCYDRDAGHGAFDRALAEALGE
jgi:hypothetical protein